MSRQILTNDFEALCTKFIEVIPDIVLEGSLVRFNYNGVEYQIDVTDYPDMSQVSSIDEEGNQEEPMVQTGNLLEIVSNIISGQMEASNFSQYDDPYNMDYEDEDPEDSRYKSNVQLMFDHDNFVAMFGEDNIQMRPMPVLDEVNVDLCLKPSDVLTPAIAQGWSVDPNLPIVVRLSVSDMHYMESSKPPKIEVFQKSKEEKKVKFGLKSQLEGLLDTFVTKWWPSRSGIKIGTKKYVPSSSNPPHEILNKVVSEHKAEPALIVNMEILKYLVNDMGFPEDLAFNALIMTKNNQEQSLDLLLNHPDKCKEKRPDQHPLAGSKKKAIGSIKIEQLFSDPHKALKNLSDEEKLYINPDYGFLVMIMAYLKRRIPSLNDYCVICDKPHVFAGNMLKPAVCSRELCCWSFQQLGVRADAADDIATEAEVVDLLVCMASCAVKNQQRRELIFDPFPVVFDPKDKSKKILDPERKDFNLVANLLNSMPSVEQMTQAVDFLSMKEKLDNASPYCYPLLQWIITSNRSHIVQLPEGRHIQSMVTKHQYLLLSAPPEKEELFRKYKKQHGSIFAFHGSSIENWHSILRKGLINASGTKFQVNGAAYGSGIYLSPHASTSFGYSRIYNYGTNPAPATKSGGNRFLTSENVNCIAICEVINKDIRKNGSIWVQPDPDCVVTRFFCVYTSAVGTATNCNTEDENFRKEIQAAIDYFQGSRQ